MCWNVITLYIYIECNNKMYECEGVHVYSFSSIENTPKFGFYRERERTRNFNSLKERIGNRYEEGEGVSEEGRNG